MEQNEARVCRGAVRRRARQAALLAVSLSFLSLVASLPLSVAYGGGPPVPTGLTPLDPLRPPEGGRRILPEALARDALGRLFVLDRAGGQIARIPPGADPSAAWAFFGVGDQGGTRLPHLTNVFAQWGPDLFALDPAAGILCQFDLQGRYKNSLSYLAGLPPERGGRVQVSDFGLTRSGELLLCDRAGGGLLAFDRYGRFLTDWTGSGEDRPLGPTRLAQDEEGRVFLLDPPAAAVWVFSREGTPLSHWRYDGGLKAGEGDDPLLGVTPWDQVVLAARNLSWVRLFTPAGGLILHWTQPGSGRQIRSDLLAGSDSLLYVACPGAGEVERFRLVLGERGGTDGP
jgi:hypothetical protein